MFPPLTLEQTIDKTVREEWGRILSCLASGLNDLQLAEDCLQDAALSAIEHWRKNGLPQSPAAWLITVARRKALDKLRRDRNFSNKQAEITYLLGLENRTMDEVMQDAIPDSRLEMVFTCCHPTLERKSQIALTLRTLGGLSTEEIAGAFLDKPETMQRRITRAKRKIAFAGIPYKVPDKEELPQRTASVLSVIYLIFNEGYLATSGSSLLRVDLTQEAIRLARMLHELLPGETEPAGLLALMLLHDSRRASRTSGKGDLISLEKQNRNRWSREKIDEGISILEQTLPKNDIGPYQLQAAISAVHANSASWKETDWSEIVALYEVLYAIQPSPIVRLNSAIAISYADSPQKALGMLEELEGVEKMQSYQPYHAARGDLLARANRPDEARQSLSKAAELSNNTVERTFLLEKAALL